MLRPSQRYFANENLDPRLRAGLVGHWIGGGSSLTWFDRSGNGNHGALTNGPIWTLGEGGKRNAMEFDGVDDYADAGNSASMQFASGSSFTVAFWMCPYDVSSFRTMVGHGVGAYKVFLWNDGTIAFAKAGVAAEFGSLASLRRWQHVAVINNVGTDLRFYLDGRLRTSPAFAHTYAYSYGLRLGGTEGESQPFSGGLDDVRIYSRALSAAEISLLANPAFLPVVPRRWFPPRAPLIVRRTISLSGSRASYHIAGSRSSHQIEGSRDSYHIEGS